MAESQPKASRMTFAAVSPCLNTCSVRALQCRTSNLSTTDNSSTTDGVGPDGGTNFLEILVTANSMGRNLGLTDYYKQKNYMECLDGFQDFMTN